MHACVDSFLLQIFHTNGSILNAFSSALFLTLEYIGDLSTSIHKGASSSVCICVGVRPRTTVCSLLYSSLPQHRVWHMVGALYDCFTKLR